jgi:CDP-diacylglycerol--serine O-phosphatidyltransferase
MIRKRSIVPSLFTIANIFVGFLAIVNAMEGRLVTASWLIIVAGIFDTLDGKVARFTRTASDFGIEFDSLADIVSFGAAPAILIYQAFFYRMGAPGLALSFLPLLFGGIRLARFNLQVSLEDKEAFIGLPIPAAACTLSAYVIFNYDLWEGLRYPALLVPLVVLVSLLMVSTFEYDTIPKFSFASGRKNTVQVVILLVSLNLILLFRQKALFPLAMSYVLFGMFRSLIGQGREEEEELVDLGLSDQWPKRL